MSTITKKEARVRRHRSLRHRISGSATIPRMSVCRTDKHLYVQLVDDEAQTTILSGSTLDRALREAGIRNNAEGAAALGKLVAEKALAANITKVVFDRGGFRYHGRIKALADAAREAGLKF
jgi:large subunit ribosomal protein L18